VIFSRSSEFLAAVICLLTVTGLLSVPRIAPVYASHSFEAVSTIFNPSESMISPEVRFGESVAISGSHVLVGDPMDDSGAPDIGAAYLYDAASGNLLQIFMNPTPKLDERRFGFGLSMDGSLLVIAGGGEVYLFDANTGALVRTIRDPTPGDGFPYSYVLRGTSVVVTEYQTAAYLFDALTGALVQTFPNPNPPEAGVFFGSSVSIGNGKILVGAENDESSTAGAAYLYDSVTSNLLHTFSDAERGSHFGQ